MLNTKCLENEGVLCHQIKSIKNEAPKLYNFRVTVIIKASLKFETE